MLVVAFWRVLRLFGGGFVLDVLLFSFVLLLLDCCCCCVVYVGLISLLQFVVVWICGASKSSCVVRVASVLVCLLFIFAMR